MPRPQWSLWVRGQVLWVGGVDSPACLGATLGLAAGGLGGLVRALS